jgi:hypothetical protein
MIFIIIKPEEMLTIDYFKLWIQYVLIKYVLINDFSLSLK